MSDETAGILAGFLTAYFFISFLLLLNGMFSSSWPKPNNCDKPLSRIEYIFPAEQLGCWLGSPPK